MEVEAPGEFEVEGERLRTLPDLIAPGLRVLFVGYNPSVRAARLGHYYAGRGNRFWRLLAEAGLTPRPMSYAEDGQLPALGIGITDLVKRPTRSAAEVPQAEYRAGRARLIRLLSELRPRVACFTGKGVYLSATGRAEAPWGAQAESLVPGVRDFVVPSPSGLARVPIAEKLSWYVALQALLKEME